MSSHQDYNTCMSERADNTRCQTGQEGARLKIEELPLCSTSLAERLYLGKMQLGGTDARLGYHEGPSGAVNTDTNRGLVVCYPFVPQMLIQYSLEQVSFSISHISHPYTASHLTSTMAKTFSRDEVAKV